MGSVSSSLMASKAPKPEHSYERAFRVNRDSIDEGKRTVELSFSSEDPYPRVLRFRDEFVEGLEVLGHDASEMDLSRLGDGTHPLLLQHDDTRQIGVIEKAWIGEDRKGRATARFAPASNALAEEIFQDVKAGIRKQMSVGYMVNRFDETLDSDGEQQNPRMFRAVSWTPYEASVVSIAADPGVGVGRQFEQQDNIMSDIDKKAIEAAKEEGRKEANLQAEKSRQEAALKAKEKKEADEQIVIVRENAAKEEKERLDSLYEISQRFEAGELLSKALKENWTVSDFRKVVMDGIAPRAITQREQGHGGDPSKSIGQQFIESKAYQRHASGEMASAKFNCDSDFYTRATFVQNTEGLTSIQKLPGVPGILDQQVLRVAQLFAQGATNALTVRYIQEDAYQQYATAVAEDAAKPEATFNVSEVDATVEKMAVVGRVTDEMFADQPAMQAYVDNRLRYMVESLEDNHLIIGSGASNQITGILNVSGIQTESAGAHATVADAFMHAINKVRSVGFIEPSAIIVHPNDWRDLQLTKDTNGQYYGGGPFSGSYGQGGFSNVSNLWGLPAVATTSIAEGTALVGSFRMAAQIFRRSGLTMESTNSDASDFVSNRIAIRAEQRLALATYKPLGFCSITGIA